MTKLAVIYYSATGHGTTIAGHVAKAAQEAGAEVRLRHIAETLDPASFAENPAWTANYHATKDLPAASGDDIVWADAVIFGSPTRFGSPSSQLRAFIDSLGGLWAQGQLADKVYAGFTSSQTATPMVSATSPDPTTLHRSPIPPPRHCIIWPSASSRLPAGSPTKATTQALVSKDGFGGFSPAFKAPRSPG